MHDIKLYLSILKDLLRLQLEGYKFQFQFVLGNSSCDMDSVLSSIFYSYLKNYENNVIEIKNLENNKDTTLISNISSDKSIITKLYVPIINCKKGELYYRLDLKKLLEAYKIEESDFVYFEEIKLSFYTSSYDNQIIDKCQSENINDRITLIDHHEFDYEQVYLKNFVTEIIDHHDNSNFDISKQYFYLKTSRIIFPRCSAFSLVLEDLFEDKLTKIDSERRSILIKHLLENNSKSFNKKFVDILICTQLQDSSNFAKSAYLTRWVDDDIKLVSKILSMCLESNLYNFNEISKDCSKSNSSSSEEEDENNLIKEGEVNFSSIINEYMPQNSLIFTKLLFDILNKAKKNKLDNLDLGLHGLFIKDRKNFVLDVNNNSNKVKNSENKDTKIKITMCSFQISLKKIAKHFSEKSLYDYAIKFAHENKSDILVFKSKYKEDKKKYSVYCHYFNPESLFYDSNLVTSYTEFMNVSLDKKFISKKNEHKKTILKLVVDKSLSRKLFWPEIKKFILSSFS